MQAITTKVNETKTKLIVTEEEVRHQLTEWVRVITNSGSDVDIELEFNVECHYGFGLDLEATIIYKEVVQSDPEDFNA